MPEPAPDPPDPSPQPRYTYQHFANTIRKLYPELADEPDDGRLTHAVLQVHPELKDSVIDPLEGIESLPYNPATTRMVPRPYGEGLTPPAPPGPPPPLSETDTTQLPPRLASAKTGGGVPQTLGEARASVRQQQEGVGGAAGSVLALPAEGAVRAVSALPALARGVRSTALPYRYPPKPLETLQAGANLLGGAMEMGTLALPEAVIAAPLTTIPALVGGAAAGEVISRGGQAIGAPKPLTDLAAELGSLVAMVGTAHLAGAPARARAQGWQQAGAAHGAAQTAVAQEDAMLSLARQRLTAFQEEATQTSDFWDYVTQKDQAKRAGFWQAIDRQAKDTAEFAKLQAGLEENARLNDLRQRHQAGQARSSGSTSPFAYLDEAATPPPPAPLQLGAQPPPAGLLGPAGGFTPDTGTIYGAPPDVPLETVGERAPRIAQSETPPPPLIQSLGELLASQLEHQPQGGPPRPAGGAPPSRLPMTEREAYKAIRPSIVTDMRSEMEDMPHVMGRRSVDVTGAPTYTPPTAGSDVYWAIVGRNATNPPTRAEVTEFLRVYEQSQAARGSDIPDATALRAAKASGYKTASGFRRSYDLYIDDLLKAVHRRTASRVAWEDVAREREAERAATAAQGPAPSPEQRPPVDWSAEGRRLAAANAVEPGAPPPPVSDEEMPAFLRDLEPDVTAEGDYTPEELAARGIGSKPVASEQVVSPAAERSAVADVGKAGVGEREPLLPGLEPTQTPPPPPIAEVPEPQFDLTPPPTKPPVQRPGFFERLKGETGHLILDVGPRDRAGFTRWMQKQSGEHGDEDWFIQADSALEGGDFPAAWKIAAAASNRSLSGLSPSEQREEGVPPFKSSPFYKKIRSAAAKEMGLEDLPPGMDINRAGILTFGPPEHNLKAINTDLLLGRWPVAQAIAMADASKIVLTEGNTDPELRLNRQIADQVARDMPDELMQPLLELLKIEDRAEYAKHLARTVSSWARGLRMFKTYQDDHWDSIIHLTDIGQGEGAVVGLMNVRTPNGFVRWLHTEATQTDLDAMGYVLPKNLTAGSKEADTFAKEWYRARERRMAQAESLRASIDDLAKDGGAFDRAMIAGALEPAGTKSRGTLDAVERTSQAFLISQASNMQRNTWTQAARYSFGVFEDVLAAGYSALASNPKEANRYLIRAIEMAKAPMAPGNVSMRTALRTPWSNSMETTYNYIANHVEGLPPNDVRKFLYILDQFPRRAASFMGGLSLENVGARETLTSRIPGLSRLVRPEVRNTVTVLTRLQESEFRASAGAGNFRYELRQRGLNPDVELAGDPNDLIARVGEREMDRMIGSSVAVVLDYTWAAQLYPGSLPAMLLNVFSNIPVFSALTRMGFPFPRFNWVSAPRWMSDHSPTSLLTDVVPLLTGYSHFSREGAPFKGRLYRGLEAQKIQNEVIPGIISAGGRAKWDLATAQQEFIQAKVDAGQAARTFKAIDQRAESTGMLPEMLEERRAVGEHLVARRDAGEEALARFTEAKSRLRMLEKQRNTLEEKLLKIKEIGAPTIPEYLSRLTVGGLMLGAAYMIRSSAGAKDTKWYEYRLSGLPLAARNIPGIDRPLLDATGEHVLDLRAFAPIVQWLLPADVMHSVQTETDWPKVAEYFNETKSSRGNPAAWQEALTQHYHGKYTSATLMKEAAAAFLSIAPAAGLSASAIDYLTGRGGGSKEGVLQTIAGGVLGFIGQFLGRFTIPGRMPGDAIGQFDPEERKARLPADTFDPWHNLLDPLIANIPYGKALLPEKVSPLTGQPLSTVNPLARQYAGLTERDKNRWEDEVAHTGIEYSAIVPRQTGDREFDNVVNKEYFGYLQKYGIRLLDHPAYQKANPDIRRDLLGSTLNGLKQAALYQAGKILGYMNQDTYDKLQSPAAKQKFDRWRGFAASLQEDHQKEADQFKPPAEPQPSAEPSTEPGAPPPPLASRDREVEFRGMGGTGGGMSRGGRRDLRRGAVEGPPPAGLPLRG